jgi:hypothetical protein
MTVLRISGRSKKVQARGVVRDSITITSGIGWRLGSSSQLKRVYNTVRLFGNHLPIMTRVGSCSTYVASVYGMDRP